MRRWGNRFNCKLLYLMKLRSIYIAFEEPISNREIIAFRSAVAEKAGRNHILFHNHLDTKEYLYRYPRIQYKVINQRPAMMCIEEGVDEIHHFFQKPSWDLILFDRVYKVKISKLLVNQFNMQVWEHTFTYNLYRWHALNQENYNLFRNLSDEAEQVAMLNRILKGNILSFAKGIGWTIDKELKVKIRQVLKQRWLPLKDKKVLGFDVEFDTNVFLPNYIGLGKNVSIGFGIVKKRNLKEIHE